MPRKRDGILFVYLTEENQNFVKEQTEKFEMPLSYFINRILDWASQSKESLPLTKYVTKSELRAKEYLEMKAKRREDKKKFPEFHKAKRKLKKLNKNASNATKL
jgi:hypothetical protein